MHPRRSSTLTPSLSDAKSFTPQVVAGNKHKKFISIDACYPISLGIEVVSYLSTQSYLSSVSSGPPGLSPRLRLPIRQLDPGGLYFQTG